MSDEQEGVQICTPADPPNEEVQICTLSKHKEPRPTLGQIAKAFNISRRSLFYARKIEREGTPEVIKEVKEGRMTINAALKTLKSEANKPSQAERYAQLKEENRLLLGAIANFREAIEMYEEGIAIRDEAIRELKEENEALKCRLEQKIPGHIGRVTRFAPARGD